MDNKNIAVGMAARKSYADAFLLLAVVISIGSFLINQVYDLDVWWHVTIGNDILSRLSVPVHDRFAAAALGRPYHDSHWLFQVVLAGAHHLAGMAGVESVMIVLWGSALFFCHRAMRRWVTPSVSYLLLFLAAMASMERFLPRPEIVTFLMIALFCWLLQEGKYRTPLGLALFGVLQSVWANCHGLFVIGPFLAGCYWLAAAGGKIRKRDTDFTALSVLLTVLLAATLLTPYPFDGWRYALLLFSEAGHASPVALKGVGELSPTFGAAARSAPAFWFFAALLAVSLITGLPALLRRQASSARLLIAVGMGAAALSGRRNMALFALAAAPFAAEQLAVLLSGRVRLPRPAVLLAALAMLAWAWFPLSGRYYLMMEIPSRFGWGATPSFFPHGLPAFLDRSGFRGQVFNSNTIGGFYLYHGYPQRLPLTDGRWEVYDRQVLDAIRRAPANPLIWQRLVTAYDIRGILLQHASPESRALLPLLPGDAGWRLVYYDHAASFWMRSDTPGLPPAVAVSPAGGLPPIPGRIDDCLILDLFLRDVGADELRLRNLERAVSFGWRTDRLRESAGMVQIKLGRLAEAEKSFQALIREAPGNLTALNELAYIAFSRGDLKGAESLLRRALTIDPGNRSSQANYSKISAAMKQGTTGFGGRKP